MARVHILLFYYERKQLVQNALRSFLDSEYTDWHLTVIDDSEINKMGPVIPSFEGRSYEVVDTCDTTAQKHARGGSLFGKFANEAVKRRPEDIIVPVCDDDAIRHDGLAALVNFFDANPKAMSAWTKIITYDPRTGTVPKHLTAPSGIWLNDRSGNIEASCTVDSSMVSFRKAVFNHPDVGYPFPATADLDAHIFRAINRHFGLTYEAPFVLQYKAIFPNQLGNRRHSKPYSSESAHVE